MVGKKNGFIAGVFAFFIILSFLCYTHDDSVVAAGFVWDGGGSDGLCSTPENWSGNIAPGSGDTAIFNSGGKYATLDCAVTGIEISGSYTGMVTLAQNTTVSTFIQSSSKGFRTTADYTLTVTSSFLKTGSTFDGNLHITGGSISNTVNISEGPENLLTISGTVSLSDIFYWKGSATIAAGGSLNTAGYNFSVTPDFYPSTVTNYGTLIGSTSNWIMNSFINEETGIVSAPPTWNICEVFVNRGSISHNYGTIIMRAARSSLGIDNFDPGSSDLYNLQMTMYKHYSYVLYLDIARSFNVLGDLVLGHPSEGANLKNPDIPVTITVFGNVTIQDGDLGGSNLTIHMIGSGKALTETRGTFKSNLIIAGSDTTISSDGGTFGAASGTMTIGGTNNTLTSITALTLGFSTLLINDGNTLSIGINNFTCSSTDVINSGTMDGTGTWDISGSYYGDVNSHVSAPPSWRVGQNFINSGSITHNNGSLTVGDGTYRAALLIALILEVRISIILLSIQVIGTIPVDLILILRVALMFLATLHLVLLLMVVQSIALRLLRQ